VCSSDLTRNNEGRGQERAAANPSYRHQQRRRLREREGGSGRNRDGGLDGGYGDSG